VGPGIALVDVPTIATRVSRFGQAGLSQTGLQSRLRDANQRRPRRRDEPWARVPRGHQDDLVDDLQARRHADRNAVSIAFDGERAFFRSYDRAWKTKRLRNNPSVDVAPATLRGKPIGPAIRARATLLSEGQAKVAAKALGRRHRLLQAALVPVAHRMRGCRMMHYELYEDGS